MKDDWEGYLITSLLQKHKITFIFPADKRLSCDPDNLNVTPAVTIIIGHRRPTWQVAITS